MIKPDDFAELYCCCKRNIGYKIKKILPLFKGFDPKKRKRYYSVHEARLIIQHLGIPPDTAYKRKVEEIYPDLFKP